VRAAVRCSVSMVAKVVAISVDRGVATKVEEEEPCDVDERRVEELPVEVLPLDEVGADNDDWEAAKAVARAMARALVKVDGDDGSWALETCL
jgi:hypothetical protein